MKVKGHESAYAKARFKLRRPPGMPEFEFVLCALPHGTARVRDHVLFPPPVVRQHGWVPGPGGKMVPAPDLDDEELKRKAAEVSDLKEAYVIVMGLREDDHVTFSGFDKAALIETRDPQTARRMCELAITELREFGFSDGDITKLWYAVMELSNELNDEIRGMIVSDFCPFELRAADRSSRKLEPPKGSRTHSRIPPLESRRALSRMASFGGRESHAHRAG